MRVFLSILIVVLALASTTTAHAAVQQISPAPDTVVTTSRPTFTWANNANESGAFVLIATAPETTPSGAFLPEYEVDNTAVFAPETSVRWSSPLPPGKYWWIIEAQRAGDPSTYGHYSAPQPFTVSVPRPMAPTALSPQRGQTVLATVDRARKKYGSWVTFRAGSTASDAGKLYSETALSGSVVKPTDSTDPGAFTDRIEPEAPINIGGVWRGTATPSLYMSERRWLPAGRYYWHPYELFWWDDDRSYRSFATTTPFTIRPPIAARLPHRSFCTCNRVWMQLRIPASVDIEGDANVFIAKATVELYRGTRRVHRKTVTTTTRGWARYVASAQPAGKYRLRVVTPDWTRTYAVSLSNES
ncbi:MAG: hypothetical protein JWM90_2235 [Thermoleophilia bacterium]|nr:hypothetical protein [Thermoleophilia bacterium]